MESIIFWPFTAISDSHVGPNLDKGPKNSFFCLPLYDNCIWQVYHHHTKKVPPLKQKAAQGIPCRRPTVEREGLPREEAGRGFNPIHPGGRSSPTYSICQPQRQDQNRNKDRDKDKCNDIIKNWVYLTAFCNVLESCTNNYDFLEFLFLLIASIPASSSLVRFPALSWAREA